MLAGIAARPAMIGNQMRLDVEFVTTPLASTSRQASDAAPPAPNHFSCWRRAPLAAR